MTSAAAAENRTAHFVSVGMRPEFRDPAGDALRAQLDEDLGVRVERAGVRQAYTICVDLSPSELARVKDELLTDPIIQESSGGAANGREYDYLIEVGFRPGVTDNVGKSAGEGIADVIGKPLGEGEAVYTSKQFLLKGDLTESDCDHIARDLLANGLIQRWAVARLNGKTTGPGTPLLGPPIVTDVSDAAVKEISLDVSDEKLVAMSHEGLWALELGELKAVQAYYRRADIVARRCLTILPAGPTDIEIEIVAQTWSEHCKHKIFNAQIDYIDEQGKTKSIEGLFRTYVKATTDEAAKSVDWLVSVFHDNAGIVRFTEDWNFALKCETHNSPSALDPYGGAITGIVGVNRDIMGAGLGCRCLFNTDVFCFASPFYEGEVPPRLFHPRRVLRGVHAGVRDGGNQSGVPDVNGAIVFHERFLGKPLVFCGTGGMIPARINGQASELKGARAGDRIVMAGGRIGKDGIHGATFSSEELHEGSPATAVQIGDAITQKKMADFLIEARDAGLFSAITDNGAGGLSSSVGEMARACGGAEVHLERAPLKYAGLAPWEIFLSEAQERMTLGVPPEHWETFHDLAVRREVEVTDLGVFTNSGYLDCYYHEKLVGSLEMQFLHEGLPTMRLKARWTPPAPATPIEIVDTDLTQDLKSVLGALNVCSKEPFVRMYDLEVQGHSVLKQFQGLYQDGPGDAAVLKPLADSWRALAIACGICPKYSDYDTYRMMAAAIDEAVRNVICVGAKFGTIAGLDNFCWPDPVQSEKTPDGEYKLAQLVRCCEALYDTCVAYGIPLISGKDSMKNDYRIGETKISIPPTVLFTVSAIVEDARKSVSMDMKRHGDIVYLLGETRAEMFGSEYFGVKGVSGGVAPIVDTRTSRARFEKLSDAMARGLVASCHDCSDGGLAAALAESAFAGGLGIDADVGDVEVANDVAALFSESQGRFVATVRADNAPAFERAMADTTVHLLGTVTERPTLRITRGDRELVNAPIEDLRRAWKRTLDW